MLRDQVTVGDLVFIYHSSTDPAGIAGIAEVARAGYPDPSAFDKKDSHFDPKSDPENPTWYLVDVRAAERLPRFVTLDELRKVNGLEDMVLLKRGSRLSIQPVKPAEWEIITKLR
jgi:predicted RNA-binding protein with PUA-like domain